jgi:flagellar biosynthesis protein
MAIKPKLNLLIIKPDSRQSPDRGRAKGEAVGHTPYRSDQSATNRAAAATAPRPAEPVGDQPRSIAVALKAEGGETPVVVASGRGSLAEAILEIAFAAGIKVRQDADLAGMLAAVEVDLPIPPACFEAVAEIMSYLYRANAAPPATAVR